MPSRPPLWGLGSDLGPSRKSALNHSPHFTRPVSDSQVSGTLRAGFQASVFKAEPPCAHVKPPPYAWHSGEGSARSHGTAPGSPATRRV